RGVRGDQRLRSAAQRYRPRTMSDVSRSALFTDLDTRPILAPLYSRGAPAGNGAPSGAEMSPTGEFASAAALAGTGPSALPCRRVRGPDPAYLARPRRCPRS